MVLSVNLLPIRKNHSEFTDYQDLNMALKQLFVLCSAMAACAIAGVVPVAPAAPVLAKLEDFDAAPQYSFAYDVQDATTGDSKAQYERREGDVVQGSYSLIEADGTRRIVDYTADPINGFNAVVSREPAVAVAAPVVAAPVVAAPAKAVAPVIAAPARIVAPAVAPARIVAPAVAPARLVAPAVAPARIVAPAVAPARIVAPAVAAAPLVAKNVVASAPLLSGSVYAPAPFPYTLPRAVASRLSAPIVYASPYAAYTL